MVSPANWLDWQRETRTLQGLAAWQRTTGTLTGVGEPARLNAQVVSSEFFPLLGVKALLGRTLSEQDDRPHAPRVLVLSHQLWLRRFGGDPSVIGRVIQLNDEPAEIIGVMPPFSSSIRIPTCGARTSSIETNPGAKRRDGSSTSSAGSKAGTTMAAARAEMTGIAKRLAATYAFNKNTTVALVPLREELTGQVHTSLLVLDGAVGLLLSIACFNVANLLLARAASRRREIAIRTSLGAGRVAIVRQLLVESLLLAVTGGAFGIALARWSLDALLAFAPADLLRVPELSVDRRVLLYAVGLSVLTGLIVGLVPAGLVVRRSTAAWMRASGTMVTQSPRVRQALVVCQVALTVVLLCGSGLLACTVIALNGAYTGVDRHNVLTMEIELPAPSGTPRSARRRFTARRWPRFARFPAWRRPQRQTVSPSSARLGEEAGSTAAAPRNCRCTSGQPRWCASSRLDTSARSAFRCCAVASSHRRMMSLQRQGSS